MGRGAERAISAVTYTHVRREHNELAHRLVNEATRRAVRIAARVRGEACRILGSGCRADVDACGANGPSPHRPTVLT